MYAIDIRNLTKDYGSGKGVFDITLAVEPGEIYGYLGPNGAGKSTTMRHLMGFSSPGLRGRPGLLEAAEGNTAEGGLPSG